MILQWIHLAPGALSALRWRRLQVASTVTGLTKLVAAPPLRPAARTLRVNMGLTLPQDCRKPGDLISVGSFSPLTPPVAGVTVTARHHGLADRFGQVSVKFK